MTTPLGRIFFGTCTLENFLSVNRLDLLTHLYGRRCTWVTAVGAEIERRYGVHPDQLGISRAWLGEPVDLADLQAVNRIRKALLGSPDLPLQHLAESQAIYYIEAVETDAILATDDRAAADFAKRRGVAVTDTPAILTECFQAQILSCPAPFDLLLAMVAAGRGVVVPPSHWNICPTQLPTAR